MILQTIRRRWKLLLLLFTVMCAACVFAACGEDEPTPQELGYTVQVVYDANGGSFSQTSETPSRFVYYKPGNPIIRPANNIGINELSVPTMTGFHVGGWYPATLDEQGEPLKDEQKGFVDEQGESIFNGEPWDFEQKLPAEGMEKLYLVASWDDNYVFTIDVGEEARAAGVKNYVDNSYEYEGNVIMPDSMLPEWEGHTIRYFVTEDGQKLYKADDLEEMVLGEQNKAITVTAEWLEGEWTVLSSPDDFDEVDIYSDLWLDRDIDMNGGDISVTGLTGEFNGNGNTISNAVVSHATSFSSVPEDFGIFSFSGDGFMHDVTFDNVTYNVSIGMGITPGKEPERFNVGLFAADGSGYDLTKFTGLVFTGCKLNITLTLQIYNEKLHYGDDTSYEGVFGVLGAEQTFTPAEGSEPVTVNVTW